MVQPSSGAGDPSPRATPPPERGGAAPRGRALPRVQALIEKGRDQGAARNTSWWDRLLESLRALSRPPILRHAVAALERGNLEAAFALLREEVKVRPGRADSALLFWNAAVSVERAGEAAEAMARLVRTRAATDDGLEEAANHWTALVTAVPEAVVDVSALAKLVPLLRARSDRARGDAAKTEALALLVDALRRCVDPANGALNPALALRLVEEARGIDLQVARAAAEVALTSSGLHEAKRAKLEELIVSLDRGEWPEAPGVAAPARPAPAAPQPAPERPAAAAAPPAAQKARPARKEKPKIEAAKPPTAAPTPRAAKPRAAAPVVPAEEKPAPGGRRTVALTQDEIEAASSRLAERMAARRAAPAAQPESPAPPAEPAAEEPVLDARDVLEADDDEPLEKDEPIAILEQDEAIAILEDDGAAGDEPVAVLENTDPQLDDASDAEFEFGGAAAATGPGGELESAEATLDESDAPSSDFEPDAEFEFGAESEDDASDADFEIGSDADAELAESPETDFSDEPDPLAGALAEEPLSDEPLEAVPADEPADEPAEEEAPPALRAIDILPVEIGAEGLVAYEVAQAQRTRVDYRAVEAIAAAEVTDLADDPTLVALLVLRARPGRPRSALRMRCDTFDPASLFPDRTDPGQALRAMLSDLLERTRAIPLPDPDSALAIQPQRFESLAAFEAAVLARLPG
jgi:hypothetical protein